MELDRSADVPEPRDDRRTPALASRSSTAAKMPAISFGSLDLPSSFLFVAVELTPYLGVRMLPMI